jgi:hypothetical protein
MQTKDEEFLILALAREREYAARIKGKRER